MQLVPKQIQLMTDNGVVMVQQHTIAAQIIYRINFTTGKQALIITRTEAPGGIRFWTSVPEGRQAEAEKLGALIEEHLKKED